jgi:hypothetical protein
VALALDVWHGCPAAGQGQRFGRAQLTLYQSPTTESRFALPTTCQSPHYHRSNDGRSHRHRGLEERFLKVIDDPASFRSDFAEEPVAQGTTQKSHYCPRQGTYQPLLLSWVHTSFLRLSRRSWPLSSLVRLGDWQGAAEPQVGPGTSCNL